MPSSRIYSQFTLWTLLIWATPQVGGSEPGQIVGCVYRNQIHYLQKLENGQIRVQRASLGPGKENNGLNVRLSTDVNQVPWRIGYGYFWVENPRRWPRFQWNKFFRLQYEKLEVNEFDPLPDNEEKAVPYGDFGEIIQSGWDDPVRGDLSSFSIAANFEFKAFYDYCPLNPTKLQLFRLCNFDGKDVKRDPVLEKNEAYSSKIIGDVHNQKWLFTTMAYQAVSVSSKKNDKHLVWGKGIWSDGLPLEVSFKEPFHSYALKNGDDYNYFFVTQSGALYMYPPAAKKGDLRRAIEVWNDPRQPITHILDNADQGKTYCFGKLADEQSLKDDARFGFMISPSKVAPRRFVPAHFKPVAVAEPLKTLVQYANAWDEKDAPAPPHVSKPENAEPHPQGWGPWPWALAALLLTILAGVAWRRRHMKVFRP